MEHTKPRENGAGSEVHYHIAVSEVLRSGRVLSSQMMRVRHEKLARSFEAKHGLEIIKGRHNRAVVHARPDLADVMKKACEGDLPKESYTSESHQGLKRKGKNMPYIKSEIVNASYKVQVTPELLAQKLKETKASDHDCSVLAFLSEVSPKLQYAFINEMNVPVEKVKTLAHQFSKLCGYTLPLAL